MNRKNGTRALLLLAGFAIVVTVFRFEAHPPVSLPDGTTVRLGEISYGTNLLLSSGRKWEYLLEQIRARQWSGLRNKADRHYPSWNQDGSVGVVLERIAPPKMGLTGPWNPNHQVAVVDDEGNEFIALLRATDFRTVPQKGVGNMVMRELILWEIPNYPRWNRTIRLRIYDIQSGRRSYLAEYNLPNRHSRSRPSGNSERDSGLASLGLKLARAAVTQDFSTNIPRNSFNLSAGTVSKNPNDPGRNLKLRMAFISEQQNDSSWFPVACTASDTFGNRAQGEMIPDIDSSQHEPASQEFNFTSMTVLPKGGGPWQVSLELVSTNAGNNKQRLEISGVPLPKVETELIALDRSEDLGPVTIQLRSLKRAPADIASTGLHESEALIPHMMEIAVSDLPEGHRLILAGIVDEKGRSLPFPALHPDAESAYRFEKTSFLAYPDSVTVIVTLTLSQSRFVSLAVTPEYPAEKTIPPKLHD